MQPACRIVWRFLKTLELPYDPEIPLLGVYPDKTRIQKDTHTPIHNSQIMETMKSCSNMNETRVYIKGSQSEREKEYHVMSLVRGI